MFQPNEERHIMKYMKIRVLDADSTPVFEAYVTSPEEARWAAAGLAWETIGISENITDYHNADNLRMIDAELFNQLKGV